MGYNTWYQFDSTMTEAQVMTQAQLLVSDGLAAEGYTTVTLDDGWQAKTRGAGGALVPNASFPDLASGSMAAQLHSMGLSLGIYTAIGSQTCARNPGSFGHYSQDAASFKAYGASFVKVDECGGLPATANTATVASEFEQFGSYLRADGMAYSQVLPLFNVSKGQQTEVSPPNSASVQLSAGFSNMWRVAPDEAYQQSAAQTIFGHLADNLHLHGYAGPGHWNDMDMLVPGTPLTHPFDWTLASQQAQAGVWAMEASPLFVSTDLSTLTGAELAVLKNPDVISIDQSGAQAPNAYLRGHVQAVVKHADGGIAVLFTDTGTGTASTKYTMAQLGLNYTSMTSRNVWTGAAGGGAYIVPSVPAGATQLFILKAA